MKKYLMVLFLVVMVVGISGVGFSKNFKNVLKGMRTVAQEGATETPLGSVTAVERTFKLDLEACGKAFEKKTDDLMFMRFQCEVNVFPETGEEKELSDSLGDIITYKLFSKKISCGNQQEALMDFGLSTYSNGYRLYTNTESLKTCPAWGNTTKEEFLAEVKQITDKFPKVSVKLLKVVH